jgi:TetR/AcrR family transcriptional regulator, transcriptional repressor of bet genes
MGRPSNTTQRRVEIVDGLLKVMASEGYAGASIVAIARAAGLRSGLIHYHFESKQAILVALVERLAEGLESRYVARLAGRQLPPRARLENWIDAQLALGEGADAEAVRAWVFVGAEALRQSEVREVYERAIRERLARAESLVRRTLEDEGRSPQRARHIAALLLASVEGSYKLGASVPAALPQGFAAPTLRDALARLLDAEPSQKAP